MHPHKYSYKYFTWMHFNKMCVCVGACMCAEAGGRVGKGGKKKTEVDGGSES